MTPEERASKWFKDWFADGSESKERLIQAAAAAIREAEAIARNESLEEAAKMAQKRCDGWRAEADTYTEDNQAKFVRNIRAGESSAIATAIRNLKTKEG